MCHCDGPEHPYDPSWCIGGPDGRFLRGGRQAPIVIIVQQAPPPEPPQWWQPGGSVTC